MFAHSPPDSVCVVRLSSIGDTCHALAVVRAIQDTWPETRITWIIGRTEATLLADIPDVEFIIFDKADGRSAYSTLRRELKGRSFDAVLCMHASMRANLIYPMLRTRHRIGYDLARARDLQWLVTNHRIPPGNSQHVQDTMLAFAHTIGVQTRPLRWDIPLSDAHREFASRYRDAGRPLFIVSPCSSQRSRYFRNWSPENYAAAARHARQKFDCRIVLTGGESPLEAEYGRNIERLAGADTVNLIGRTTLKQLLALIDAAAAILCPDSGPAHMATTVNTPVIGLYATTNPGRSGPYFSRETTVDAYPDAARKYLGKPPEALRWGQRIRDPGAMGLIRLASVNECIDTLFDLTRTRAHHA